MKRYYTHILVWLGLFILRLMTLLDSNTFIGALLLSLPLYLIYAIVFYSTAHAHHRYFEVKKYFRYTFSIFAIWFGGILLCRILYHLAGYLAGKDIILGTDDIWVFRIMFFIIFGVLYQVMTSKKSTEEKNQELQLEKKETELRFLKSQMNPHFFFNTLNNIYGLAYRQDKSTTTAILKLSDTMRYIIYETQEEMVPLQKELQFIENYVELERLRLVHKENLNFQNEVGWQSGNIAPLILLPFVENCFKHSNIDDDKNAEISISIWIENTLLHLTCGNTISKNANYKEGGIGTENVLKRLEMLYGNKYHLETDSNNEEYYVHLSIPVIKKEEV
ncbi:histidine kinase [Puteibacter caeruleilacunae]|nr:histidine kinase [Puteibacter caeruleilacunae]